MDEYLGFLASKAPAPATVGIDVMPDIGGHLFDYQAACAEFHLRQGRSALFLDTGLGKTIVELEFSHHAAEATNGRALILTPLAVARQFEREAAKFGYEAKVIRDQSEVEDGISICNYDRLDKIDSSAFGSVTLDEASILKAIGGKTAAAIMAAFHGCRFKLSATATPAPNDHMELGQQSEFCQVMAGVEMLSSFFINDASTASQQWRIKRHAETAFWDWMASWSRMAETPEDLGFDGSRFVLPEMEVIRHRVFGDLRPAEGSLFAGDVSATGMHDAKRQTAKARAEMVAAVVAADSDEPWVVWCDTDYEADALRASISGASEVRGSHPIDRKEETLAAFATGDIRVLITKPSVAGYGLNWQHCARMAFAGRSFSYELWYQAIRRCWRFGQTRQVQVHLVVAEGEQQIGRVIDRKSADHTRMKRAMAAAMKRATGHSADVKIPFIPTHKGRLPQWLTA